MTRSRSQVPETQAVTGTSTSAWATCARLFARSRRVPGWAPRKTMIPVGTTTIAARASAGNASEQETAQDGGDAAVDLERREVGGLPAVP